MTTRVGQQDGFFDCQACQDCLANIKSQADVEVMYQVRMENGESITVHMGHRDMIL